MKSNHNQISRLMPLLISIIAIYFVFHLVGIGCPILFLTGIPCAGCGMTRAWASVLHGHFHRAFYYHPLYWTVPLMGILFLRYRKLPKKVAKGILIFMGVVYIIVYFIRLLTPGCSIVAIDISEGFMIKFLMIIKHIVWRI